MLAYRGFVVDSKLSIVSFSSKVVHLGEFQYDYY